MIGQEGYQANQQCGATDESIPTNVTITDTSFVGNVATLEGGGIHLEAGSLVMEVRSPTGLIYTSIRAHIKHGSQCSSPCTCCAGR